MTRAETKRRRSRWLDEMFAWEKLTVEGRRVQIAETPDGGWLAVHGSSRTGWTYEAYTPSGRRAWIGNQRSWQGARRSAVAAAVNYGMTHHEQARR